MFFCEKGQIQTCVALNFTGVTFTGSLSISLPLLLWPSDSQLWTKYDKIYTAAFPLDLRE